MSRDEVPVGYPRRDFIVLVPAAATWRPPFGSQIRDLVGRLRGAARHDHSNHGTEPAGFILRELITDRGERNRGSRGNASGAARNWVEPVVVVVGRARLGDVGHSQYRLDVPRSRAGDRTWTAVRPAVPVRHRSFWTTSAIPPN